MQAVLSREEKGRLIAEKPNQIQRLDERFYKVASQNGHGMYDVVRRENGSWICGCFDYHLSRTDSMQTHNRSSSQFEVKGACSS